MVNRTIAEINTKIQTGQVRVCTVETLKAWVAEQGISAVAQAVDVVTAGTFEPMESCGAILNLGQTDPPLRVRQCWLDGVMAYGGLGAVDLYLGAAQPSEDPESERGGGHVIADLIAGKAIHLKAIGQVTDCYPRTAFDNTITRDTINQFYLFNPRNLYQNFIVGVNGGEKPLHTYLGTLQPSLGNAIYASSGALSPLLNDPELASIGIGTRVFLGGGIGYVVSEGTQHFPLQKRLPNDTPIGPAATLAIVGDAKQMNPQWVRGCFLRGYGPSLMLGIGVAFPVLNDQVVQRCAVKDEELVAPVVDFAIPRRVRPTFGLVNYAQLKSGKITIDGRSVRTAPLTSIYFGTRIAEELKTWVEKGTFLLTEAVAPLPMNRTFLPQDVWGVPVERDA
ncbi:MAG: homocysteine biosynthesis protein [Prochlorotrichaceae cyanobacterium]|jgi:uncharacterized protein (DUF39 family)